MRRVLTLTAAAPALLTVATPQAQRRGGNRSSATPLATNTIRQHPEQYEGKEISVSAAVERVLSPTAFLVDQRRVVGPSGVAAVGAPILVIAPNLKGPLPPTGYLLMSGQLVKYDAAAIARVATDYALDLPSDFAATYAGQPVLVATSVIDGTHAELAKKPAPALAAAPAAAAK